MWRRLLSWPVVRLDGGYNWGWLVLFWLSDLIGMPSTCLFVNYRIKKNVIVFLSLIWFSNSVSLYMWNFSSVFIIFPFFTICSTSIISSIGPIECLFSSKCCANSEHPLPCLKSLKCSRNLVLKKNAGLAYVFLIKIFTN